MCSRQSRHRCRCQLGRLCSIALSQPSPDPPGATEADRFNLLVVAYLTSTGYPRHSNGRRVEALNLKKDPTWIGHTADRGFHYIETTIYVLLGMLLAIAALIGLANAAMELFHATSAHGDSQALVIAIDGILFVLMVVEILHTVRASFRSGTLVCEPFLIVGLIASIRRVLVITLETSQVNQPGKWSSDSTLILRSTMQELAVLGGLILVMVVSIYLLRRSNSRPQGVA